MQASFNVSLRPISGKDAISTRGAQMSTQIRRRKLVHVLNGFRSGAIPHIIRDLHPTISAHFDVEIVVIGDINYADKALAEFSDLRIRVHALKCRRWNLPQAYVRLRRYLLSACPDIVHGHTGRAEILTPLCRPRNTKAVVTHHNVIGGYHWATRSASRLSSIMLDGRSCVSDAVKQSWYGPSSDTATVIYNPIDTKRFSISHDQITAIRREFRVPDGSFLLVSVGRINKQKAHSVAVRAVQRLRAAGEDCKLVIAGRGENEAALQKEISRLDLESYVVLAGFRDDVPSLVAAADVFVFPSLWEGLGLAALEAMAAGAAIAASKLPPIEEYITHEETGLLSQPEDDAALALNIQRLLRDPVLRKTLSAKARQTVQATFGAESIAVQYLELYKRVSGSDGTC
jgi:glycosyltransferase involved in cell wall biosynthesis